MENINEKKVPLSDDELEDVTGGLIVDTLVSRVDRRSAAMFSSTLEDRTTGKKRKRKGVRLQTLENRPDDAQSTPVEWL